MLKLEDVVIANDAFELFAELEVPTGTKAAIIGPSGAGKSTLIGGIAGFMETRRGRILWNGRAVEQAPPGDRPISMLFQDGNLFPHLSIADNVGLGISARLGLTRAQTAQVEAALARVGLDGMGARKPAALSGGQQSRAALARVLVQNRPLILLDEPFAALGPALKRDMSTLVGELARENDATLMMVSHDPEDAKLLADSAILVADGRAHAPEPVTDFFENPPSALKAYLG
ncbi:MAG: ATP-binding cassette domain-containing protein [Arenibacterium sp.]